MLSRELHPQRDQYRLSRWLGLALTVQLVLGLLLSLGVIALFANIAEEVAEGESRRFDEMVLLWIHWYSPGWLDEVMRFVTVLGDYWVVVPLLAVATYAFYRKGRTISAGLLVVSTVGGIVLTTTLKTVLQRDRPELFDSGYTAAFCSFPSGHATIAVGFYGTLTLLVAWRFRGFRRWAWCWPACPRLLMASRACTSAFTTRRTSWPAFSRRPCGSVPSGSATSSTSTFAG